MAVVVLVHGIAQEQKSADTLEEEWLPDLAGGVRVAGFDALADRLWRDRGTPAGIDTRMAFYGDLFLTPDQQGGAELPEDLSAEGNAMVDALAEEWLARAADRSSGAATRQTAERELRYTQAELGEEQGLGSVARHAVNGVAKIRWFAPFGVGVAARFVSRALGQVVTYLTDESVRTAALDRVTRLLGPETRVIIGHSLGSVVAYEAVQRFDRPLPLLVTVGSPLGLRTIVYEQLRPQPPTFPPAVRRWVNVCDRDDFIAAEPDLSTMFSSGMPADALFENGWTVDNGAKPHRADFYLTKREIGLPIGESLSQTNERQP